MRAAPAGMGASGSTTLAYGDAFALSDFAQGGNDTLKGSDNDTSSVTSTSTLIGDAQILSGRAKGGDDTLISGTGNDDMYDAGKTVWAKELRERRPDVSMETIEKYLHNLYRVRPEFVYSVSREFAKSCQTPILVLPDDVPAHPMQTSIEIASLCPNAEITVYPWKEPADLKARTINRARTFLKGRQTA